MAGGDGLSAAADPSRKEVVPRLAVTAADPPHDGFAGLLGQFELHRAARLLLEHRRSRADAAAEKHVIDPERDDVAAAQLAVDGKVEQGKIAEAPGNLEANANGPDLAKLQRRLLSEHATAVPR